MPKIKYSKTRVPGIYSYKIAAGLRYLIRFRYKDSAEVWKEKSESGFETIAKANIRKAELKLLTQNDLSLIEHSKITFKQWYDEYFKMTSPTWSPDTRYQKENIYKNHLTEFNQKILSNLTLLDLQQFINRKLYDDKLSVATTKGFYSFMMAIINSAVEYDILPKNKLKKVTFPDEIKKEKYIDSSIIKLLDEYISNNFDLLEQAMYILAKIGWRRGEIAGFTHGAFHIRGNTIEVTVSKTRTQKTLACGKAPKTKASFRVNILIGTMAQSLIQAVKYSKKLYQQHNLEINDESFVFINTKTGTYQTIDKIYHILKKSGQELNLVNNLTPHMLRHTFASNCINNGMSPASVAKWLGHSKVDTTLNIYSHSSKQSSAALVNFASKQ